MDRSPTFIKCSLAMIFCFPSNNKILNRGSIYNAHDFQQSLISKYQKRSIKRDAGRVDQNVAVVKVELLQTPRQTTDGSSFGNLLPFQTVDERGFAVVGQAINSDYEFGQRLG